MKTVVKNEDSIARPLYDHCLYSHYSPLLYRILESLPSFLVMVIPLFSIERNGKSKLVFDPSTG